MLHRAGVDKLQFIFAKVETKGDMGGGAMELLDSVEWWRAGLNDRFCVKMHRTFDMAENQWVSDEPPQVEWYGYDSKELRTLSGWDAEDPPKLPLVPGGADASLFAGIKGSITPRSPTSSYQPVLSRLLIVPVATHDLKGFVESSSEVELVSSEDAVTLKMITEYGKVRITLDPKNSHLIKRREWFAAETDEFPSTTTEVTKFRNFGNDTAFPEVVISKRGEKISMEVRVTEVTVNENSDSELAILQFPEGARVNDPTREVIHIWGKTEPQQTLQSYEKFLAWEATAARANDLTRSQANRAERPVADDGNMFLIWVNISFLAIIAFLFILRKRLSKGANAEKESAQ